MERVQGQFPVLQGLGTHADITEQRQTVGALRESEEKCCQVAEHAAEGILIIQETLVQYANSRLLELWGGSLSEVIGTPFSAYVHPEERSRVADLYRRRLAGEEVPSRYETALQRRDGSKVLVEVSAGLITYEGKPADVVFVHDITERRQAEQEHDRLFNLSVDLLCVSGFDGSFKQLNPAWEKTLGWTNAELMSRPYLEFVHPEDREAMGHAVRRLSAGEAVLLAQNRYLCKDGSYRWLSWNSYPLVEEHLVFAVARDITEQRRDEARLESAIAAEREQRLIAQTLSEITVTLTSLTELPAVLDEILRQARRLVPFTSANIALLTGKELSVVRSQGYEAFGAVEFVSHLVQAADEAQLGLEALRSREPVLVADTLLEPRWGALKETAWIRSYLAIPICLHDRAVGLLGLDSDKPDAFSLEDAVRLRPLASAAAVALENVRLMEAIREARRRMEGLQAATSQFAVCVTEDEVCQQTVKAAVEILNLTLCTLDLVEGDKLIVKAASKELPLGSSVERALDEGLAGKTYRTGETCVFGSLDEVPEALPTREEFRSGISAAIGDLGVFQVVSTEPNAFTQDDARSLELLLAHTRETLKRMRLQQQVREQAIRDPLTSLHNRRFLDEVIPRELALAQRHGHAVACAMLDVNRFKEINDRFGHQMGDRVLQAVADLLTRCVRESDTVVRYGGDEFLIIVPETKGEAQAVVDRIRVLVAKQNAENPLMDFPVTLAIGVATWRPGDSRPIESALSEADRRMYEDKRGSSATK